MTLQAERMTNCIIVIDTDGGRWWPSQEARKEIETTNDPEAAALRICDQQPKRGEWKD